MYWLDYAVFNMLIEDYARSEECLKEFISLNQNELNGLMLYSVICAMQEKNDVAETFLQRVTAQDDENVIAWTLYAMLYEQMGQEMNAEITIKRVLKINQVQVSELQAMLHNQLAAQSVNPLSLNEGAGGTTVTDEESQNNRNSSPTKGQKEEEIAITDESKLNQSDSLLKSRGSKRGMSVQLNKIKLDNRNKSPKSPGNCKIF